VSATRIYIKLLDELVDVWRPVDAVWQKADVYRIISENPNSEDEQWEFRTGELVRSREARFSGGETGLVAFERSLPG
jgi:hypothetical protein